MKNKEIFYYDSVGNKPPNENSKPRSDITTLLENLSEAIGESYSWSSLKRQKGGSECGVYAVHFLISMVTESFTINEYLQLNLPDDTMQKFRDVFWRKRN